MVRHLALSLLDGRGVGIRPSEADVVEAVRSWVKSNIRYVRERVEVLEHPLDTLAVRGADCDGHAVLVASLLEALGVATRLEFVGPEELDEPIHTYASAWIGDRWQPVDTVLEEGELGELPRCWLADGSPCHDAPPGMSAQFAGVIADYVPGGQYIEDGAEALGGAIAGGAEALYDYAAGVVESAVELALDGGEALWRYARIGYEALAAGLEAAWEFLSETLVEALTDKEWWASLLIAAGVCVAEALLGGGESGASSSSSSDGAEVEFEVQGVTVATTCSGAVENALEETQRVFLGRVEEETGIPTEVLLYARNIEIDFDRLADYDWPSVPFDSVVLPDLDRLEPGRVPGMAYPDSVRLAEAKIRAEIERQWQAFRDEFLAQTLSGDEAWAYLAGAYDDQLDEATRRELARTRGAMFARGAWWQAEALIREAGFWYYDAEDLERAIPFVLYHGQWVPPTSEQVLERDITGTIRNPRNGLGVAASTLGVEADLRWTAAAARLRVPSVWARHRDNPRARPAGIAWEAWADELDAHGFTRSLFATDSADEYFPALLEYATQNKPVILDAELVPTVVLRQPSEDELRAMRLEAEKTRASTVAEVGEALGDQADEAAAQVRIIVEERTRRVRERGAPRLNLDDELVVGTDPPIYELPEPEPEEPLVGATPDPSPSSPGVGGGLLALGIGLAAITIARAIR